MLHPYRRWEEDTNTNPVTRVLLLLASLKLTQKGREEDGEGGKDEEGERGKGREGGRREGGREKKRESSFVTHPTLAHLLPSAQI